jgi:hypothetical protein
LPRCPSNPPCTPPFAQLLPVGSLRVVDEFRERPRVARNAASLCGRDPKGALIESHARGRVWCRVWRMSCNLSWLRNWDG